MIPIPLEISPELAEKAKHKHDVLLKKHSEIKKELIDNTGRFDVSSQIYHEYLSRQESLLQDHLFLQSKMLKVGVREPEREPRQMKTHRQLGGFPSGLYDQVDPKLLDAYRASGILPYCRVEGKAKVLLVCEDKSKKKKFVESNSNLTEVWTNFGGKRSESDRDPAETAIREVAKESLGVLDKLPISVSTKFVWNDQGKYLLWLVELPYDSKLEDAFTSKAKSQPVKPDQLQIKWVDFEKLKPDSQYFYNNQKEHELYSFFAQLINERDLQAFFRHGSH